MFLFISFPGPKNVKVTGKKKNDPFTSHLAWVSVEGPWFVGETEGNGGADVNGNPSNKKCPALQGWNCLIQVCQRWKTQRNLWFKAFLDLQNPDVTSALFCGFGPVTILHLFVWSPSRGHFFSRVITWLPVIWSFGDTLMKDQGRWFRMTASKTSTSELLYIHVDKCTLVITWHGTTVVLFFLPKSQEVLEFEMLLLRDIV